jgi:putative ABC transport system substrate-binding protein
VDLRGADELEGALAAVAAGHVEALITLPDALFIDHRRRIVDFTAANRLPALYAHRPFVTAGGLMAYGPNLPDLYRPAATYVDTILRGAKPAELPVEQPTEFDFLVNLKTAQRLALTIPQSVLMQATEVIH